MGMVYVLGPGGQYNHLIARRVIELGFDVRLRPAHSPLEEMRDALAFIIGGGPGRLSLGESVSQNLLRVVQNGSVPVLGICYGHQFIAFALGGRVEVAKKPEFGPVEVEVVERDELFQNVPERFTAWLSHNDEVTALPPSFRALARSERSPFQAMAHQSAPIYGVLFHIEVEHTQYGREILSNFLRTSKG
jgi:GMP synthase (glutamine-hydrolyzing), N-terminal domain or A subunit